MNKYIWYVGVATLNTEFRKRTLDQRFDDFSKRLKACYKKHNIPEPDYGPIEVTDNVTITRWFRYDLDDQGIF